MIEARVSAVITAYNSEAFIAEAIRSVLDQSRAVDEIVVVDDGSTDHTRQIVAEFADQGIKFVQQHNKGAGGARNRGIRETNGVGGKPRSTSNHCGQRGRAHHPPTRCCH